MANFTRDWNEATPLGTTDANMIDDIMKEGEVDISDRLKALIYGFIAGENDGVPGCKNLAFKVQEGDPTVSASTITLYSKDVSSESHLYFKDESGDIRQITKAAGLLNIIAGDYEADSIDEDDIELANDAYLTAANAAGTGTVDLIKAGTDDVPIIPDGAKMASSAAPTEDEGIANMKYVDDQDAADHPAYSGGESHTDGSGLTFKMGTWSGTLANGATHDIEFDSEFDHACIAAIAVENNSTQAGGVASGYGVTFDKTKLTLYNKDDNGSKYNASWIAIGY